MSYTDPLSADYDPLRIAKERVERSSKPQEAARPTEGSLDRAILQDYAARYGLDGMMAFQRGLRYGQVGMAARQ